MRRYGGGRGGLKRVRWDEVGGKHQKVPFSSHHRNNFKFAINNNDNTNTSNITSNTNKYNRSSNNTTAISPCLNLYCSFSLLESLRRHAVLEHSLNDTAAVRMHGQLPHLLVRMFEEVFDHPPTIRKKKNTMKGKQED
jgi:hypothetical protein